MEMSLFCSSRRRTEGKPDGNTPGTGSGPGKEIKMPCGGKKKKKGKRGKKR